MTEERRKVFVVDDESVIASTLASILNLSGLDARSFVNPVVAYQAAVDEKPDLLISDVMMPEMLGTDLAILIKKMHLDCKVLLFSGQASTVSLLDKARLEGHDFTLMAKPVHPSDLLNEITRQG